MKKILCYIDSMQMGGAQRVMANLTKHFAEKNISVLLVNDIVPINGIPEYEIDKNVRRLFLDQDSQRTKGIHKNINRILSLRKLVKKENPDIVLSFIGPPNIRMLVATIGLKTGKYVSVRNDPYREYGNGIKKIIANLIFNLCDGCVFQTEDAANFFNKKIRTKSKIILNPVRQEFFEIDRVPEEERIVMVGRLNSQKNYPMAIKAFSKLASTYPKAQLHIFGDGELREELTAQIDQLGLSERIILEGRISNVASVLANATIYMLTSDYEGMPNSLMEAMAVGVPSIATNCPCGGVKSLINDEQNGIMVRCGDVEDLCEKLSILLEDKNKRLVMSRKAREESRKFETSKILSQWDEYLGL